MESFLRKKIDWLILLVCTDTNCYIPGFIWSKPVKDLLITFCRLKRHLRNSIPVEIKGLYKVFMGSIIILCYFNLYKKTDQLVANNIRHPWITFLSVYQVVKVGAKAGIALIFLISKSSEDSLNILNHILNIPG